MIYFGEKLNSSIPKTLEAMERRDEEAIVSLIRRQADGSDYLDVNTAMCQNEADTMAWTIGLILKHYDGGIMIDTTNPFVMGMAAELVSKNRRNLLLNSLTLTQRFDEIVAIAKEYGAGVVALPISSEIPQDASGRIENARMLIEKLTQKGIAESDLYIDVLAEAIAVQDQSAKAVLETIRGIRAVNQRVHLTCGLSNLSFGLPGRRLINGAFLIAAVTAGLDSAICDPSDEEIKRAAHFLSLFTGDDEYCIKYISWMRENE